MKHCHRAALIVMALQLAAPTAASPQTVGPEIRLSQARPDYRIKLKREADGLVAAGRRALKRREYQKARALFKRADFLFPGHKGAAAGLRRVKAVESRARKRAEAARRKAAARRQAARARRFLASVRRAIIGVVEKKGAPKKFGMRYVGYCTTFKLYVFNKIGGTSGNCKLVTTLSVLTSPLKAKFGTIKYALQEEWVCCNNRTSTRTGYCYLDPQLKLLMCRRIQRSSWKHKTLPVGSVGESLLIAVCRPGFGSR